MNFLLHNSLIFVKYIINEWVPENYIHKKYEFIYISYILNAIYLKGKLYNSWWIYESLMVLGTNYNFIES